MPKSSAKLTPKPKRLGKTKPETVTLDNGQKLQGQTVQIMELMDKDIHPADAYAIIKGHQPHKNTITALNRQWESWNIHRPKAQKAAHQALYKFAKGQKVGEVVPTSAAVLGAAQRIVDANDPVVHKSVNLNMDMEISPVDLAPYRTQDQESEDNKPG